jgi:hypothetical protein
MTGMATSVPTTESMDIFKSILLRVAQPGGEADSLDRFNAGLTAQESRWDAVLHIFELKRSVGDASSSTLFVAKLADTLKESPAPDAIGKPHAPPHIEAICKAAVWGVFTSDTSNPKRTHPRTKTIKRDI